MRPYRAAGMAPDHPNPDGALSSGIYCTVELLIPRKPPSVMRRQTLAAAAVLLSGCNNAVARIYTWVVRP
jgi:hypothetical protein